MLRSKQQQKTNQPNQEASSTSRSRAVPHSTAREHVHRAPSPGEPRALAPPRPPCWPKCPSRGWRGAQEGKGPLLYQVFLSGPPLPGRAGPSGGTGRRPEWGEQPAGLDLCCQLCQWRGQLGWGGRGGGQLFIPGVSGSGPCPSPLCPAVWAPAPPRAMPPPPCSASLGREFAGLQSPSDQQPWGLTPTSRADAVPELWGAQAPLAPREGLLGSLARITPRT